MVMLVGRGELTFWPAFFNYLKSMIGLGLLSLPWAFAQTGLLTGSVSLLLLGYMNWYTDVLVVRVVAHERAREYAALELPGADRAEDKVIATVAHKRFEWPWQSKGRAEAAAKETERAKEKAAVASAAAASAEAASATEAFGPWGVCYRSLGRVGQLAAVGAMVVGQLGVGIVYTDYIATFLQSYALSFRAWVALLFVANSALCLARPLGAVSYISGLGCLVYRGA